MIWGLLGSHIGESMVVLAIGAIILLRFRRYRAVGAAAVGLFSSVATVVAGVIGVLVLLVALGYWEPPIATIIGDALGAAKAVWNLVGEWLLEHTVEALEGWAE